MELAGWRLAACQLLDLAACQLLDLAAWRLVSF